MISPAFVDVWIKLACASNQGSIFSPTSIEFSPLSIYEEVPPYSVSQAESIFYYSGLPSSPKLVYRTGTTPWKLPRGPEAYRRLKQLYPVFSHRLNDVWKDLGPKIWRLLDSHGVFWTTIDVVRFIMVGEGEVVSPVVLWIGVAPDTPSGENAHTSANGCLALLKQFDITDVEVEYRESTFTRSAGPSFLEPVSDFNPTVNVRGPLTTALGLSIAGQTIIDTEGTGGLYLAEGGGNDTLLLVTARHVLFPPNKVPNVTFTPANISPPRRNDLLFALRRLKTSSIQLKLGSETMPLWLSTLRDGSRICGLRWLVWMATTLMRL